jgi:parallel beta-helix repeat protein
VELKGALGGGAALAAAAALLAGLLAAPAPAGSDGRTIHVRPGPDALQRALDRADDGDTLRVHEGRYPEDVTVRNRLRIVAADGDTPVIDGRCRTARTIAVRRSGVHLRGLTVVGAAEGFGFLPTEVDFSGVARGSARGLVVRDTCGAEGAEYGVNVFQAGPIKVIGNRAGRGFSDAGIYVGSITDTGDGALSVRDNLTLRNNVGIIVEDSAGGDIRVRLNRVKQNTRPGESDPTGILIRRSDGALIEDNTVRGSGRFGIYLDPDSERNVLNDNVVSGSGTTDLRDEGSGNCGSGNSFGSGDSLPPC